MMIKMLTILCIVQAFLTHNSYGQDEITLQLRWHHGGQFIGYYVAQEKGFYAEEKLDISFLEGGVGINHVDQVLQGHADFGIAGSELVIEYLKGTPVQSAAVIFQHSPYAIMVRDSSGINNPQQLAGKRMYMAIIPRTAEVQAMLINEGVNLETIKFVNPFQGPPDFTDLTIDAFSVYQTNEPFIFKQKNHQPKLIKPIDYGVDFYGDCLFSTKTLLKKDPELAERFIRASLKGWKYAFDNPDESIRIILESYNTNDRSEDHLRYELLTMRSLILPDHIPIGTQSVARWRRIAEIYSNLNMAPDVNDLNSYIYDPGRESIRGNIRIRNVFLLALSVMVSISILLYLWSRSLRSQVASRTQSLHEELASHKETKASLEEALSKYATLFHLFPYGITVSDSSGAIVETNEVAEQLLGIGKTDHEKRKIDGGEWTIIRPDGTEMPQEEWPSVAALLEKRTISGVEMGVRKPNGDVVWLAVAATPIPIENYGIVVTYNDITQVYLERQKLNKLVNDQSAILDNIHSLIFFKDTQNNIIHISQSVADLTGLPRHEIEGRHSRDIYPDMADQYWKDDLEVIKSKQSKIGIIEPLFDTRGDTRWLLTDKVPYIDSDGIVSGVIVMATDITDRITSEEHLKSSEAKLKAIFRNNPAGIVITTLKDGVIIDCNESIETITGYTKSELVGRKTAETNFWPKGLTQREEVVSQLRRDGSFRNLKIEFTTKQKEKRQGLFSAEVIRLEGQEHIITTMFDLTELQMVEQALLESKQKYQSMLENIGIGVALINQDMEIVELNKQMRNWFPAVDTALNPLCYQVLNHPPKDTICDCCPTCKTLQDGKIHESISETPGTDGIRNFRIVSSPIVNSKGEVTAAIELVEDITDQLKYEEQLRKAQRMESIGDLAGGIAHDFNNILSPIIGYSEMLIDELPQQSREWEDVNNILKAGKRGRDLVKQILSFSRQPGQEFIPTRIQHTLKEVLKLSRSTIPAYIELNKDIDPNCGLILGDPSQLHQVAMNLITNAYHAVEDSGGKINVKLSQAVLDEEKAKDIDIGPGFYAVLQVSDTGSGMSKELIGKIFDPYFTTKEQGKGTGLGLAVVHGIVKGHGGAIKVDSEIGKGTTFDIYLPLMEKPIACQTLVDRGAIERGNERILLVDDEEAIVTLELRMLERLGYKVTSRVSCIEALELFKEKSHSFDLVISDMAMPKMAGDILAKELKAIRPDIPIIICTGFSERIREDNMQKIGINGLLMKPVLKSDLAKVVRKVLDESK
ncbi:PAS domain S-box protein [Desulfogranum marinum]|uniref:PAS domain S-box protein n=1 Tax=Desulfogranum marinum TaxID=453220 RepID=UPI0029C65B4A|nr:PAS domain S-box protein [Desulfogranum marinum]